MVRLITVTMQIPSDLELLLLKGSVSLLKGFVMNFQLLFTALTGKLVICPLQSQLRCSSGLVSNPSEFYN